MVGPNEKQVKLTLLTEVKTDQSRQSVQGLVKDYAALDRSASEFSKRVGRYFETGQRAADDARRSVVEIQQALAKANDEATDPRSVQVARSRAAAFRDELDEARRILETQEQRVRVEEQINDAQRGRPAGGIDKFQAAGDVSSGLSAAAQLLPGGAGNTVRGLADVAGLIEYLPRLSQGIQAMAGASAAAGVGVSGMVAALGPIALVAGAATVGLALIKKAIDEANTEAERHIAVQKILIGLEHELTTLQAEEQRKVLEERVKLLQLERQAIVEEQARREQDIRQNSTGHELDLVLTRLVGGGGLGALNKDLEENEQATAKAQAELDGLNTLLDKSAFATNDAAEAERRLAEERTRTTIAEIEASAARRLEAERLKAEGTSDQVANRLAEIQRARDAAQGQIEDLRGLVGATEEGRAAIAALETEIANLNAEERILKDEVLGVVAAREREISAMEAYQKAADKATQSQQTVQSALDSFNNEMAAMEQKLADDRKNIAKQGADRILEIETRLAQNIESAMRDAERADDEALRKLNDDIASLDLEAAQQELELREETAERITDLEERAARERERILNQYKNAEFDAIQNRDAVALDAAQRTRDQALKDTDKDLKDGIKQEKEALKKRLEEDRRANEQRLSELRQSYQREQRDRQIALNQRLYDLQQAAAQEINLTREKTAQALSELNQRFEQERQIRNAKFAEILSAYSSHMQQVKNITTEGLNEIAQNIIDTYDSIIANTSAPPSASGSSVGSDGYVGKTGAPEYNARGVRNFKGGWSWVGEEGPELRYLARGTDVYSNRESMKMAGGTQIGSISLSIVTQGTDANEIKREIWRDLPDQMARAIQEAAG